MKYLVLENNYTALTVNSIKQNMPDAEYKVVPIEGGKIPTALKHCTEPTMVVMGGIVLNIKEGDLPSAEKLKKHQ
jgi:precorrin-6B methylase 2